MRWLETVRFQSKPKVSPTTKLTFAFLTALEKLAQQKSVVERLWHAYWTTLQRGLLGDLNDAEDLAGIREVANILGLWRANPETEPLARLLFERARLGLVTGTAHDELFSKTYIDSMVTKEQKKQHIKGSGSNF